MTPQNKLYEAAKALIGDLINKRSHFNSFQNLCRVLSEYEQSIEQPEAIAGENESAKDKEIAELKQRISVIKEKLPDNKIRDLNPIWVRDKIISELEKLI